MVILQKKVPGLSAAALERFVLRARRAAKVRGRVNVLVAGSAAVQVLNRRFLRKNKVTDVLSFPAAFVPGNASKMAGEIAISANIAAQNAQRMGHSILEEVKILTLHGILHLAGFDHERDNGTMARKEQAMRRALHLPGGLIERMSGTARESNPRGQSGRKTGVRKAR